MGNKKNIADKPLSRHFADNKKTSIKMSPIQKDARDRIIEKIKHKTYNLIEVNCPICNSRLKALISEKDAYGLPVHTSICKDCGFIYSNLRFSDETLKDYYVNENIILDRGVVLPEKYLFDLEIEKGKIIMEFLKNHSLLKRLENKLIVEIGCGSGGILAYFKGLGFKVLGCDIDRKPAEYGYKIGNVDIIIGTLENLKKRLRDEKMPIGLIMYEQSLEHMPYPKDEIIKVKEIMSEKTILFVGVPGFRDIDKHYDSDILQYLQPGHLLHFDLQSLSKMMSEIGLSLITGNEKIQAVFKNGEHGNSIQTHSYENNIKYLKALENNRKIRYLKRLPKMIIYLIVYNIGHIVKINLEKIGLLETDENDKIFKIINNARRFLDKIFYL
ncbi:MAG: methyltransferase domain-containing protein [Patescibacteria group bacterium]|nr:class I SAM-dependent methyltransferase [Patescibacteria group bacterium]MDE1988308.1 methyltransferase domain-containing protein [Patescibacteria group bacterium]MDE2218327.1 methyltransferase domain-containing protein [Patescibacteria group bacterium]